MFCDRILIFDNLLKKVWISVLYKSQEQRESQLYWLQEKKAFLKNFKDIRENQSFYSDNQDVYNILKTTENEYVQKVLECQRHILSGDSYELCLTNSILASTSKSSFSVHDAFKKYCKLRKSNPAPYSCFIYCARLELGIICSSPERFLKIDKDGWAECKPIKGTLKRNLSDEKLDIKLVEQLRSSAKDRAENLMIADLILNDLTRTCDLDSVHASKLMEIETFATVHHMVSTIRGKLSSGQDPIDCIRTCFPPGSMTGAPKKRSMDILHEIEKNPRGIYSGCIGYFSVNRAAEFNVVIRTIVSTLRNANEGVFVHEMEIGCGGAIISLSDPLAEYEEMKLKSEAVLKII
jgi:para-aminobenzoate synthetase